MNTTMKSDRSGFLNEELSIHKSGLKLLKEARAQVDLYESSVARTESIIVKSMMDAQVTCVMQDNIIYRLKRDNVEKEARLEWFEISPPENIKASRNI
jgi:hypothetical protein